MSHLHVGDVVIETTPSGRTIRHQVTALDQPPSNPGADPGPYVNLTDNSRGGTLQLKPEDIAAADWLQVV